MPKTRRKWKDAGRPRYLWFKLWLVVGAALGMLLLVQSTVNYVFVSSRLVINQLHRDANKQAAFLERHARQMRIRDPGELADLLDDVRKEGEHRIAWIRVTGIDGHVFVQSGEPIGPPFRNEQLRPLIEERDDVSEIRETPGGKVLVTVVPLRIPPGTGAGGSGLAALRRERNNLVGTQR